MTYEPNKGTMVIPVMLSQDSIEENIVSKITSVIPKPKRKVFDPHPDNVKPKKKRLKLTKIYNN